MRIPTLLLSCFLSFVPLVAFAQSPRAFSGQPFGIASVSAPATWADTETGLESFSISDEEGRVFYPAFAKGVLQRLLTDLLGAGQPTGSGTVNAYFLFKGDKPFRVTLHTPQPTTVVIRPRVATRPPLRRQQQVLVQQWWREYNAVARRQQEIGDYPPLIHDFLTSMLGRRMRLAPPLTAPATASRGNEAMKTLDLIAGSETLRSQILKQTVAAGRAADESTSAVPQEVAWPEQIEAEGLPEVDVEPIAMHVPHECFYIRFGSFNNYLWLNHLLDDYGGEVGQMVQLRGHNLRLNERMELQLALKQSALADLLGGQVISDMAIIGRDAYLREGAAIGLMFEARNQLLTSDIKTQRADTLKAEKERGATEQVVEIGGQPISFLSTPDNRVRSFLAIKGKYHLVTTSREIVRRFLEASDGKGALGASAEFRHARRTMPRERRDTVFAYFSRKFMQSLVSPQYQIELNRRLQAVTDLDIVTMAQLVGKMEGVGDGTVDGLIDAGVLPANFDVRPDGSKVVLTSSGAYDSVRGGRGSFTPIPDVPINAVTAKEKSEYAAKAAYYEQAWKQLDPLVVGVKRTVVDPKGREKLTIDAYISPVDESKYGWALSVLGPATKEAIVPTPNEIFSASAVVQGGMLDASVPPHHLFVGVLDSPPGTDLNPTGLLKILRILQTTPGYLGAWPKPGYLDRLPFGLGGGEPDANGYSQLPLGLLRRQFGSYSLLSFDQRVLEQVSPEMNVGEVDTAAQVRVHVGDLSKAKIRGWLNDLYYQRSRQTTAGNLRLLQTASLQLGVPSKDSRNAVEQLLDAELTCSLKGDYELATDAHGRQVWTSTKLTRDAATPEKYTAPIIGWFRGLDARLIKLENGLHLHAELEMQRKPKVANLFQLFGGKKKPKKEKPKVKGREF